MLALDGFLFSQGRSKFSDHHPKLQEPTAKIYVKIRFAELDNAVLAQLDTGAAWSVLAPDVVRVLGVHPHSGKPSKMSTRLGLKAGQLVRIPFSFPADEGKSLEAEGTFFVCPDWPEGLTFLGYSGLLDSIRFALDPQRNDFYFGPC